MSDEKRLDTLTEEIKLLKGEIKNSLTSVRDYLLNMELPSSEFSTILAALSGDNSGQKVSLDGGLGNQPDARGDELIDDAGETADDLIQPPADEDLIDMEQPEDLMENIPEGDPLSQDDDQNEDYLSGEDATEPEEDLMGENEELENPEDMEESRVIGLGDDDEDEEEDEEGDEDEEDEEEENEEDEEDEEEEDEDDLEEPEDEFEYSGAESEMPAEEEQPMELERTTVDNSQGTPRVNMLANLINWISRAKREIGDEMLPTFLDVYGVSGHLSLELKEVILSLADRTKEKTEPCTDAEVWSQAMLSLHGILTGGDAPLNPAIPAWREALNEQMQDEEIIEVDKQDKPIKLKFVLPGSNGKEKEYCLDLSPDNDDSV